MYLSSNWVNFSEFEKYVYVMLTCGWVETYFILKTTQNNRISKSDLQCSAV